ncbi:hypothetical protein K1T71_013657 [Dendrolimus kikuchii]|uniref:Uncharacterized protein n=1 Tax=Dendrolimus kikuchii TaxID=765133 RepID=A0ACC1CH14_9NEOP|nr:hypothetical protein K1T71_013657 [Dendrolimus kikuchii]
MNLLPITVILITLHRTYTSEDGYLRYVKDSCFVKGEALNCVKYKALKLTQQTLFGEDNNSTIQATKSISFVPLDNETLKELAIDDKEEVYTSEPRSFLSEWAELAKYFMKVIQDFFKMKGMKVNLPEGARTVEDDEAADDSRGKKKKLAVVIPLLNLLATIKTKFLLIPILLAVMLIKKLLLVAALLLPSLLSTLKACKQHHPMTHYSYFGSNDANDYSADYGSSYAYSSGGGYGKDWASNRAYSPKHRPSPAPVYITGPGNVA